jgi:hypothetical protein
MLINLTEISSEELNKNVRKRFEENYGSILDMPLPVVTDEKSIIEYAENYFMRITAAFDTCANEPKPNVVCMNIETELEKKLMSMLLASSIEVILSCS